MTLFVRRPTRPTEAGRVFIEGARAILAETDELIARTVRAELGEPGAVRVGYILSAAYDTMPRLIRAVAKKHPDVQVVPRESWTPDLDAALQNGDLDVAVFHTLPDRPEYLRRPLRRENFVAVVDINHPFAQRGSASFEEFEGQTLTPSRACGTSAWTTRTASRSFPSRWRKVSAR
ncbi:LysR family transcriptional regulator [Streptomyces sp. RTd22]|uniref:LysR family transcriptional regulator n=1 Tax=Streptomyces sp. RTd22 TaxID=1841249 RepID=UPI000A65F0D0|nr:LysR substrate-binding domain-containing protein [Streptomyces sp. RTd22]